VHPDEILLLQIIGVFYQDKRPVVPAWLPTSEIFRNLPDCRNQALSTVRRLARLGMHPEFDWGPVIIPGYLLEDVQACLEKHFGCGRVAKSLSLPQRREQEADY